MPEIIDDNAQNNASSIGQGQSQAASSLGGGLGGGDATVNPLAVAGRSNIAAFDAAFGYRSCNSKADLMVALLDEAKKKNPALGSFVYGTWPEVDPSLGSVAWFAGEYNDKILVGAVLFEVGDSFHITTQNNAETYYTTVGLFKGEQVKSLLKLVESKLDAKFHGSVYYMGLNAVPEIRVGDELTEQWAMHLLGQLMLSIFGRAKGFLGSLVPTQNDRYIATVVGGGAVNYVVDANGHAHRADFELELTHMPVNANQQSAPTLTGSTVGQSQPRLSAAGYVNLRYIGLRPQVAGQLEQNLQQLQPEVIGSIMDSQSGGSSQTPIQRQLIALASLCALAADGGWRDLVVRSFDRENRKVSALAYHMNWGGRKVDTTKLDNSAEGVSGFLDNFCLTTAAVVLYHRSGNGIGGLSALLAEVAVGHAPAIVSLLALLDEMFPNVGQSGKNFSQYLVSQLQAVDVNHASVINARDIVAAAVPTVAGVYYGSGQLHSFQEADLVRACNFFGDKAGDVMDFMRSQSYTNRSLEAHAQRVYLLKLYSAMFAANKPKATGEALEMALNPVFGKALLDAMRSNSRLEVNGVSAFNAANNSLFVNGQSFALSGTGTSGGLNDFGLGGALGGGNGFNW